MSSGAANLLRQPAYAALVGFELSPNDFPDMYFALVFHRLNVRLSAPSLWAMKKREPHFLMSSKALERLLHHK